MKKAVFLDRDGVIIMERGDYNYLPSHVIMVPGIVEALQVLKKKGFIFIIITNQGGIVKGLYTHRHVQKVNFFIEQHLQEHGIAIKDIFYDPHHDTEGKSLGRKPDSLMLEKAMALYDIDPAKSYFIGDKETDRMAAEKAGVNPVLIPPNGDLRKYLEKIK